MKKIIFTLMLCAIFGIISGFVMSYLNFFPYAFEIISIPISIMIMLYLKDDEETQKSYNFMTAPLVGFVIYYFMIIGVIHYEYMASITVGKLEYILGDEPFNPSYKSMIGFMISEFFQGGIIRKIIGFVIKTAVSLLLTFVEFFIIFFVFLYGLIKYGFTDGFIGIVDVLLSPLLVNTKPLTDEVTNLCNSNGAGRIVCNNVIYLGGIDVSQLNTIKLISFLVVILSAFIISFKKQSYS